MFQFGGLGALFGGLSPQKPPRGDETTKDCTSTPYHNLLHTYRYNGDSIFEKKQHIGGPN